MLTISSGHSASYLTDAVAAGRENYYSGAVAAGEPPGRWYGAGATALGLEGVVDAQDMTAVFAHFVDPRDPGFRDPAAWSNAATLGHRGRAYTGEDELYAAACAAEPDATAERRVELRLDAGRRARRNVAFLDATFSVQKSITVLHTAFEAQEVAARREGNHEEAAAWGRHREAVESAIWAGNRAALDYLAARAGYSRVGHHGGAAGRFVDAHDFVVASFFQHDSRDHDPQLHIHNAILNRVQGSDGIWRTLDGRSLYAQRGAAAAVAERTTEQYLTRTLGIRFAARPDGKAREIVGVPSEVTELFSSRRRAITGRTRELTEAFAGRFDREPNALELDRLQRQATFATRRAKSHRGEKLEDRLERWDRDLRAEIDGGLRRVARDVLALAGQAPDPQPWSSVDVLTTALADVQSRKAAWTASDLTRAVSDALPDHLGDLDGAATAHLLDGLAAQALESATPIVASRPGHRLLPDDLRLANGTSAYDAPGRSMFTTPDHIRSERLLRDGAATGTARALSSEQIRHLLTGLAESGLELGHDQTNAVRGVLGSGAAVECLVGPAGTGKSFVVGVLAKGWADNGGRVFGLAASQAATDVLTGEGLQARNIARWLVTQQRLDRGDVTDAAWRLTAADLVVVDESAMTDTADLARVHARVADAGAKLLLCGDHRQLSAVGAAGAMAMVAAHTTTYELAAARRFQHAWEASASLRLREGDPRALAEYHKHGRLLDCGNLDAAERSATTAWLADSVEGRRALLVVDSNEQAARLNATLRAELVRLGRVSEIGVPLDREGTVAGVGDIVQTRANAWHLEGHDGNRRGPVNREYLRVLATLADGGLHATTLVDTEGPAVGEILHLPADYVREHVVLGYAATVHAAQGRTVDTAHVVVGGSLDASAVYVAMSRGRRCNTAHVVTTAALPGAPAGVPDHDLHRNPGAVLAALFERYEPARSALDQAEHATAEAGSLRTAAELFADAVDIATAGRTAAWLDGLVDDGHLRVDQRTRIAAEDNAVALHRLLRRAELAGHDARTVLREAVVDRPLDDARQLANVVAHRIHCAVDLEPTSDAFAQRVPAVSDAQWAHYLHDLAAVADARSAELGLVTLRQLPAWAVERLGPVPADPEARNDWLRRAGTVATHRELTGHDDPTSPLGPPPTGGQPEAAATWHAAWRALGGTADLHEEAAMSTGQLLVRIRAWEREQAWAPRYVANELAGTSRAAAAAHVDASLRRAEADATADPENAELLRRGAFEAAALATLLDARCVDLIEADAARAGWYAHTAATRAAADRAKLELATRDLPNVAPITAEQWLATHRAEQRSADRHRPITSDADFANDRSADLALLDGGRPLANCPPESAALGRAVIAPDEDEIRVPTAEQTAETLARARGALAEIARRDRADAQRLADERRVLDLSIRHFVDPVPEEELHRVAVR
ncbi:MAG: MobF family relaxase [Sporichthyaceae bacterium]